MYQSIMQLGIYTQFLFTVVASSHPTFLEEEAEQITSALSEVKAGEDVGLSWRMNTNPTIGFYRALHTYLKKTAWSYKSVNWKILYCCGLQHL